MATNTNLQKIYASDELNASSGTYVSGSEDDVTSSNRRQVETFVAAEAIVSGDAVSLDLSQTGDGAKALVVVQADTGTATDRAFVGIALESAAQGGLVRVCVQGVCDANVDGATVAGSILQIGATAGRLAIRTVAVDEAGAATFNLFPIAAIACEADVANVATVIVYKQGI